MDWLEDLLADQVEGAVEESADFAVRLVVDLLFGMVAGAVEAITAALSSAIVADSGPTSVDLGSAVFSTGPAAQLMGICGLLGGALLISFFMMAVARSVIAGDVAAVVRSALVEVPLAIFKASGVVVVAQLMIDVVDESTEAVLGGGGANLVGFSSHLASREDLTAAGLLGLVFALVYVVASVVVWFQLVARAALIYLLASFSPLAFAAGVYGAGRQLEKKFVMLAIALIVSKFAQAGALALGAGFLEASSTGDGALSEMMIGAALMLMAAFTPWLIYSILPAANDATAAAAGGSMAAGAVAAAGVGAAAIGTTVAAKGVGRLLAGQGSAAGDSGPRHSAEGRAQNSSLPASVASMVGAGNETDRDQTERDTGRSGDE